MAEQKVVSKKVVTGKVATDKAAGVAKKAAMKNPEASVAAEPNIAKPAVQKEAPVAAKPAAKKSASAQRKAAAQSESASTAYSPEQRYRMVETAAYFIAERNGFQGDAAVHWQVAELEIAQLLGE